MYERKGMDCVIERLPQMNTEGFGLVFLEANACGIPVVAGTSGGSIEAVTNESNGLTVDSNDPK